MRRRAFIAGLGSAAAGPLLVRAQQPALPVIGFVDAGSAESSAGYVTAFRKALGETGYVEGQNVTVEYHWLETWRARERDSVANDPLAINSGDCVSPT